MMALIMDVVTSIGPFQAFKIWLRWTQDRCIFCNWDGLKARPRLSHLGFVRLGKDSLNKIWLDWKTSLNAIMGHGV